MSNRSAVLETATLLDNESPESIRRLIDELSNSLTSSPQHRIEINSQSLEQGLARLVVAILDFIRRLLELQAIRRMEGGTLSEKQIEDLGLTLMRLEEKMDELKERLGANEGSPEPAGRDFWEEI